MKDLLFPVSAARIGLLCALASASLLIAALGFEHLGGLVPCQLCLWQRWPHLVVITSVAGLIRHWPAGALAVAGLAAFTSAAIGLYHFGVEQKFWSGPAGCSAGLDIGGDIASLTDKLLAAPVVRCDEIAWSLFGLSMAGWNMLASLFIALAALGGLALLGKQARNT